MSRAYRIRVKEGLNRVITKKDRVSTKLDLLEILCPEEMADMLEKELKGRGFECNGESLSREQDGVVVSVDVDTGVVTVTAKNEKEINLEQVQEGMADEDFEQQNEAEEKLRKQVKEGLEAKAKAEEEELQKEVTNRLEAGLAGVKTELNQAVNRVTAEALKKKAASLGNIKQLSEEPGGNMTIVLEV